MNGNFVYHNPTKLYFGPDSLNGLEKELKKYGPNICSTMVEAASSAMAFMTRSWQYCARRVRRWWKIPA